MAETADDLLKVEGLTKVFAGLTANEDISFTIPRGAICGLIGPNGAGKSTLFKTLLGVHRPTRGRIVLDGRDITGDSQQQRCRQGLCCTFQIAESFNDLSILEAVMVGAYSRLSRRTEAKAAAREAIAAVGLSDWEDLRYSELNAFLRKKAELATALATKPKLLLLDELFAGCSHQEIAELIGLIDGLNRRDGITFIIVEHVLHVIMSLSAKVIVLESGRILEVGSPREISTSPAVLTAYLGEDYDADEHQKFGR
ncbi:ABC transporter ATP-binding protein [Brucella anthropi]|uniref:ABC transporter ATP-binding protein n=1 Tax=Brucella anthropi TaxID=529 RepID=UPI001CFD1A73|nr:ATP-binding cassette domain-containing protein [Brucella anthropi]